MTVRLRDVADRAGVSVKTVSNVVHGYPHVSPETRRRVQAALDELDYRPNLSARTLRRGRSGLIALALPALDIPYFGELASETVAAAAAHGWTVLVDQTDGEAAREREVAAGLEGHLIDGLLLSAVAVSADELRRPPASVPMVLLGERFTGDALDHVAVDNVAAARTATEHLLTGGRRRVAAIGYQEPARSMSGVAPLRQTGYEQALAAHGLAVDPALTPQVESFGRPDGVAAADRLLSLDDPPDAVFCFTDVLALGALRSCALRGVRVPEDIAVVGFDDIEDGRFSTPTLSTVSPDKTAIARTAVELLSHRLEDPRRPARDVTVGFELVVRESSTTGAP
jgi:DNA-binding LacI/PurR family transcriptional regulator